MGHRYRIELKPGYTEPPTLWTATVAESGTAKSPAMKASWDLLQVLQGEAKAAFDQEKQEYECALAEWQAAAKEEQGERAPKPTPPQMEHFFTTDATMEAVVKILGHEQSRTPGLVVQADELVGFLKAFDQYRSRGGGERQNWMQIWSSTTIKSDRVVRDPFYVERPVVAVVGGIQPSRLPELANEATVHDGFIPRFLFEMPDAPVIRWTDACLSNESQAAMIHGLRELRYPNGAGVAMLSQDAKDLYVNWRHKNADEMEEVTGLVRAYYAKLGSQLARLALILHGLTCPSRVNGVLLAADTMSKAIELVEYYLAHSHLVLRKFGAGNDAAKSDLKEHVLQILEKAEGEWMTTTDIHRSLGGHIKAEDYRPVLDALVRDGQVEREKTSANNTSGGRPTVRWRIVIPK